MLIALDFSPRFGARRFVVSVHLLPFSAIVQLIHGCGLIELSRPPKNSQSKAQLALTELAWPGAREAKVEQARLLSQVDGKFQVEKR